MKAPKKQTQKQEINQLQKIVTNFYNKIEDLNRRLLILENPDKL